MIDIFSIENSLGWCIAYDETCHSFYVGKPEPKNMQIYAIVNENDWTMVTRTLGKEKWDASVYPRTLKASRYNDVIRWLMNYLKKNTAASIKLRFKL